MDRDNLSGMDQEQEFKEELDRLEREGKFGERNHLLLSMFPDIRFKPFVHSSDISSKKQ